MSLRRLAFLFSRHQVKQIQKSLVILVPQPGFDGIGDRRSFGAWFEPDHHILETGTPFFAKRFADMDWMIATPQGVARFEDGTHTFHPPAARPDLPEDASEALWGTYFANIFNPARLHLQAMRTEIYRRRVRTLLIRQAERLDAGAEGAVPVTRAAASLPVGQAI